MSRKDSSGRHRTSLLIHRTALCLTSYSLRNIHWDWVLYLTIGSNKILALIGHNKLYESFEPQNNPLSNVIFTSPDHGKMFMKTLVRLTTNEQHIVSPLHLFWVIYLDRVGCLYTMLQCKNTYRYFLSVLDGCSINNSRVILSKFLTN